MLIARNEREKCLIEPSINSVRVKIYNLTVDKIN